MSDIDIFSIMPVEVFMDERLSKTDLRVLGAILTFRNKNTNLCWPKRSQIAERCLLSLPKISTATTHLVSLGWLKKSGNGGCSRASNYQLCVPEIKAKTVPDSGTVPTVPDSGTQTVPDSGTITVPDSGRGIQQTNEQTIKQTNKDIRKKTVIMDHDFTVQDVVNLYHVLLVCLPKVLKITPVRERQINNLIKGDLPSLLAWQVFFQKVSDSPFLTGKQGNWKSDLEWLTKPANALKVAEGRYDGVRDSITHDDLSWADGLH